MLPTDKTADEGMARKRITNMKLKSPRKYSRFVYIPTVLTWVAGLTMTFCSAVKPIGQSTVFWTYREYFVIVGPVTLGVAVAVLMATVALINRIKLNTDIIHTVSAPLFAGPPSPVRSFSYCSERDTIQECPKCNYKWSFPTDIKIDIDRGETEKCRVYITNKASCSGPMSPSLSYTGCRTASTSGILSSSGMRSNSVTGYDELPRTSQGCHFMPKDNLLSFGDRRKNAKTMDYLTKQLNEDTEMRPLLTTQYI